MRQKILTLSFLVIGGVSFVQAQNSVSKSIPLEKSHTVEGIHSVKEVLELASVLGKSEKLIQMQGVLTSKINDEEYWFEDPTGKIMVSFEDKENTDFELGEDLIVSGKLDNEMTDIPEFKINKIVSHKE